MGADPGLGRASGGSLGTRQSPAYAPETAHFVGCRAVQACLLGVSSACGWERQLGMVRDAPQRADLPQV